MLGRLINTNIDLMSNNYVLTQGLRDSTYFIEMKVTMITNSNKMMLVIRRDTTRRALPLRLIKHACRNDTRMHLPKLDIQWREHDIILR